MRELFNNLRLNINNGNTLHTTSLLLKVFENIQEGIMITDAQMKILFVNNAFEFVTGYKKKRSLGKDQKFYNQVYIIVNFIKKCGQFSVKKVIGKARSGIKRKSGEIYPEWLSIMEIKDENDNVTHYCGIFTDLSERKRVEDQLEKEHIQIH